MMRTSKRVGGFPGEVRPADQPNLLRALDRQLPWPRPQPQEIRLMRLDALRLGIRQSLRGSHHQQFQGAGRTRALAGDHRAGSTAHGDAGEGETNADGVSAQQWLGQREFCSASPIAAAFPDLAVSDRQRHSRRAMQYFVAAQARVFSTTQFDCCRSTWCAKIQNCARLIRPSPGRCRQLSQVAAKRSCGRAPRTHSASCCAAGLDMVRAQVPPCSESAAAFASTAAARIRQHAGTVRRKQK